MSTSLRARWNSLSPAWRSVLLDAANLDTKSPGPKALREIFESASIFLRLPSGKAPPRSFSLAPLALFPALEELQLSEGFSLASLPTLPALRRLQTDDLALPDDLGARLPGLSRLTFTPLAAHAEALAGLRVPEVEVLDGPEVDLSVLARLPALRRLVMSDGPVKQVRHLAALTRLEALDLRYTKVRSLAPLAPLTRLRELDLSCTRAEDLSPLAALTRLRTLSFFGCPKVRDLSALRGLTALRRLDLTDTAARDLSPLAALTALTSLRLDDSEVADLSPLAALPALTELGAPSTRVRDLTPLASVTSLAVLDLRSTAPRDLTPLYALPRLREVDLDEADLDWRARDALEAALRRRPRRRVTVRGPRRPLAEFSGALDAAGYAELSRRFAAGELLRESGAVYVSERCVARPGDWGYAITRMAFDEATPALTLWLDFYGEESELTLVAPRGVRVGPEEFRVKAAKRVVFRGEAQPARARTVFRLA
ncbi:MAG: leucine-rich repeat domain-containing protein [Polyangiales bacterium]